MTDSNATIESMGIKEWLASQGAIPSQINSKTVDMLVQGMTDEEISTSATAREEINRLERRVSQADAKADTLARGVRTVEDRYSRIQELLEQTEKATAERTISDPAIVDGINAFARMLESVRDTFGEEKMTESVICAAIEAGSYGYWRSIMGPKSENEAKRRDSRRVL